MIVVLACTRCFSNPLRAAEDGRASGVSRPTLSAKTDAPTFVWKRAFVSTEGSSNLFQTHSARRARAPIPARFLRYSLIHGTSTCFDDFCCDRSNLAQTAGGMLGNC